MMQGMTNNTSTDTLSMVAVVIPVYSTKLTHFEELSLKQAKKILHKYPIIFAKPKSLCTDKLKEIIPQASSRSFPDHYFYNIKGYNSLMLSDLFYKSFFDFKYILVHQLDAFVFTDQLTSWTLKDYDYIGAPWVKRVIYDLPVIKQFMKIESLLKSILNRPDRQNLFNKVGNGGLSLRKIASHYNAAIECKDVIDDFNKKKRYHLYNEDVFWSVMVNKYLNKKFIYPDYIEALSFSFDKHPSYCFKLNHNNLPFGCHGWSKKKMLPFWRTKIMQQL
jgi:hypothetical protein